MADKRAFHEDFSREADARIGSDRSFGIVFAVVFAVIGLFPLWAGAAVRPWALTLAGAVLFAALAAPKILGPANRLWFRFGMGLHRIVTPVVLGFVFFSTVVPTAVVMRMAGKDPLRLSSDRHVASYWIKRDPPGPDPQTMRNQF